MASGPDRRVALLSIHPRFARSIMSGEKRVEFRKVRFRDEVSHIIVYATSPVQKVLGYFGVSHIDEAPPGRLWARYGAIGGVRKDEFRAYFASSSQGVAIGVGEVEALREPLPLSVLGDSATVPQSFSYLGARAFEKLRELLRLQGRQTYPPACTMAAQRTATYGAQHAVPAR